MLDFIRTKNRYEARTAVVFGAAGALGSCVCRQLYVGRARVIAFDRDADGLARVQEKLLRDAEVISHPGTFEFFQLDMGTDESVEALRAEVSQRTDEVDMLLCVAGGVVGEDNVPFPSVSTFRQSWQENFLTVPKVMFALLDLLVAGKGAISVTSSANAVCGLGQMAYSSAKVSLHAFVRCFAVQYGHLGLRANLVVLGTAVDPNFPNARWAKAMANDSDLLSKIGAWSPRDKSLDSHVPHPEEAAAVLCFLASPEASMINGSEIVADTGWGISVGTAFEMKKGGAWFNRVARSS